MNDTRNKLRGKIKKNRNSIKTAFYILLSIIIGALLFKNIIVYLIVLGITSFLNYKQGKLNLGFGFMPDVALVIVFSMTLGFWYGLIFYIIGTFLPGVVSGGVTQGTLIFPFLALTTVYFSSLSLFQNLAIYGFSMILLRTVLGLIVSRIARVEPTMLISILIGLMINTTFFLIISKAFLFL